MASGGNGGRNRGHKNGGNNNGSPRNPRLSMPFRNWDTEPNNDNDIEDDGDEGRENFLKAIENDAPFKSKYFHSNVFEDKTKKPITSDQNILKPVKEKRLTNDSFLIYLFP